MIIIYSVIFCISESWINEIVLVKESEVLKLVYKERKRLSMLGLGNKLLTFFLLAFVATIVWFIVLIVKDGIKIAWTGNWGRFVLFIVCELLIFFIGMVLVNISSKQMGIKYRALGLLTGWIPIVNLVVLTKIIGVTGSEYRFEKKKMKLNDKRIDKQICRTQYPILMVHGVFFRDFPKFNYWGRVPDELQKNGATIFYGEHQSAAAVADSAEELADRIKDIVRETGCDKVNVIAHSKGGLDTKYAIAKLGMDKHIASLTTINTPHNGCEFADYLLSKAPEGMKEKVAKAYNSALKKLGDKDPSFIAAVSDLTASACRRLNDEIGDYDYKKHGVYTQSVGSWMKEAGSGAFPLNMSYLLVKHFDGPNDGLVGEPSFHFGENYTFLENKKSTRGISHGDMIDLNRENIPGFDVREFYVQLVADLKKKGF